MQWVTRFDVMWSGVAWSGGTRCDQGNHSKQVDRLNTQLLAAEDTQFAVSKQYLTSMHTKSFLPVRMECDTIAFAADTTLWLFNMRVARKLEKSEPSVSSANEGDKRGVRGGRRVGERETKGAMDGYKARRKACSTRCDQELAFVARAKIVEVKT
mmetsp:Transcript_47347/g.122483  ORF Transcript_47347/g.122483 Transcript_47347/m.122483 type:complete len:155 (+) Transcript_47347:2772-3236(+)